MSIRCKLSRQGRQSAEHCENTRYATTFPLRVITILPTHLFAPRVSCQQWKKASLSVFSAQKAAQVSKARGNLVSGRKQRDAGTHVSFSGTIMCLKSSVVAAAPSKAAQPREWVLIRTGNFSLSYFGGAAKLSPSRAHHHL